MRVRHSVRPTNSPAPPPLLTDWFSGPTPCHRPPVGHSAAWSPTCLSGADSIGPVTLASSSIPQIGESTGHNNHGI